MKRVSLLAFFIILTLDLWGQSPQVPRTMRFANLELHLNEQVRREIQTDVDNLTRSQKYFNIKLERAKQYFPIIERIFREENVPDDFKYLVIQESALISDAVSTANAIGFWQFKEASGREVGLRIDNRVDERLNIVSSTRGAARYLKTNNFYFKNWLYALLAYNMGRAGAESHIDTRHFGAGEMDINKRTHWYIKKFLAHMIAYSDGMKGSPGARLPLFEYTNAGGRSLDDVAREMKVDPELLSKYNKWLKRGDVPLDKTYTVIVPGVEVPTQIAVKANKKSENKVMPGSARNELARKVYSPDQNLYPVIEKRSTSRVVTINGLPGIVAGPDDDLVKLANIGDVPLQKFLRFNDVKISHEVTEGEVYYFKKKRSKAKEYYHTVYPGETSWSIAQKYGIRERKLLRKNRFRKDEVDLKPGLVLWLRFIRPSDYPKEYGDYPREVVMKEKKSDRADSQNVSSRKVNDQQSQDKRITVDADLEEDAEGSSKEERPEEASLPDPQDEASGYQNNKAETGEGNEVASQTPIPLFHLVESGETLFAISRKYGIPVDQLVRINGIEDHGKLQIGQKIYLREPFTDDMEPGNEGEIETESQKSYIFYEVRKGDTMYSISKKFGIEIDEIMKWNDKTDYQLKEGEKIKIPGKGD